MAAVEVDWHDHVLRSLAEGGHRRPVLGDQSLLEGGFSRSTWRLAVDTAEGPLDLVASVSGPRGAVQPGEALPRDVEGRLLRALAARGAPVPAVHGAADHGGWGFVVMDHVAGETRVRPALRDDRYADRRGVLARSLAESLVRIHRSGITPEEVGLDPVAPEECADRARARWGRSVEAMAPGPRRAVLAAAVDELAAWPVPPPASVVVVHGDFRLGNVAYTPEGVRAVLDWELAHFGDPVEDVAWPLLPTFRFGTDLACGLVRDEDWVAEYQRCGGWEVDGAALRFWTALGLVKMTCLNQRSLDAVADEGERAVLERQAQDLLAALEVALAAGPAVVPAAGGSVPDQVGGPRT